MQTAAQHRQSCWGPQRGIKRICGSAPTRNGTGPSGSLLCLGKLNVQRAVLKRPQRVGRLHRATQWPLRRGKRTAYGEQSSSNTIDISRLQDVAHRHVVMASFQTVGHSAARHSNDCCHMKQHPLQPALTERSGMH